MDGVTVLPTRSGHDDGPVALVLSSGANMGAVQVGVVRALIESGVRPDLIVGCSVGALNGAALAHDPSPDGVARMEELWLEAGPRGVLRRPWLPPALALMRRGESMASRDGLYELISRSVSARSFADLAVPLHCLATDVEACREAWFSDGPLIDALLASAAVPAMFPAVRIGDRRYVDGGVVNEVPVHRAVELGARTVYVVEVGPLTTPFESAAAARPISAAIEAYWVARRHRFRQELDGVPDDVTLHLMPHGEPPRMRLGDFSQSATLIDGAYRAAAAYLARPRPLGTPA